MLVFDYFRGQDSTGLAAIKSSDNSVGIAKGAINPIDLFDTKKFTSILNGAQCHTFIGHNRAATKGKVNNTNAHPFYYGKIVGVHNGTLDQGSWDALETALGEKFDVDSQALICALDRLGIDETIKMIRGAWSLVWYNTEDRTLNFLRNKERPMWYSFTKEGNRMIWASEYHMINSAVCLATEAQKYTLMEDDKGHSFFSTEVDTLYTFDIDTIKNASGERPKAKVRQVKGKEPLVVSNSYSYNGTPFRNTNNGGGNTTNSTTKSVTSYNKNTVVTLFGNKDDPFAGWINEAEFDSITKYGCSFCKAELDFSQEGLVVIEDIDVVLCPKCSGEHQNRVYVPDLNKVIAA